MDEIDFLTLPQIQQLLQATENPLHRLQILLLSDSCITSNGNDKFAMV